MKFRELTQKFDEAAPLQYAADWDMAGTQIDPAPDQDIRLAFVCLDVTDAVVNEAVQAQANVLIGYHPLLFSPVKQLTCDNRIARLSIQCIQNNIAVYSPHTALDAVPGGLTDGLCGLLGEGTAEVLEPSETNPSAGHGRRLSLQQPVSVSDLAQRLQHRLSTPVQYALTGDQDVPIQTAAVCPGAGASLLENAQADVIVTGEMRHHDLLAFQARGQSVILCGHAASERWYLPSYAETLRALLGDAVDFRVATKDEGPINGFIG